MDLYDPSRVLTPLRRGNPAKGRGIDPDWQPISWDAALQEITERLAAVHADDPRKVMLAHMDVPAAPIVRGWATAFGTPHTNWSSGGLFCGMGTHTVNMLVNGGYNAEIDFEHCAHVVLVGTQMGFMTDTNAQWTAHHMARARARGMKVTVIDPVCGIAGGKADRWIPIRPGTDAALALGVVNQLVNVLGVYDAEFLRRRTNATYLVGPDGRYLRDRGAKPLVWNATAQVAVAFDACDADYAALEGEYAVNEVVCRPAFAVLKDHVARYTPGEVQRQTDIPEATLVEFATELAEDARIGETTTFGGEVLPLRPVCLMLKMGVGGHKHAQASAYGLHLIPIMLGAINVPGGVLGIGPVGPWWEPEVGPDGLMVASDYIRSNWGYNPPFPGAEVSRFATLSAHEAFPTAIGGRVMYPFTILDREGFGLDITPEVLIHARVNLMMSSVDPNRIADVLSAIPFQVSCATHLDETVEFADIVLPDAHDMERHDLFPANHPYAFEVPGPGFWYFTRRRPVVAPAGEARHWGDVLIELAGRLGLGDELVRVLNAQLKLDGSTAVASGRLPSVGEIAEKQVDRLAGADKGRVGEINGTSVYRLREKFVEEAYPGPWMKPRLPIYQEHLLAKGDEVRRIVDETGLSWSTEDYIPLPEARPSAADDRSEEFDLYAVTYKLPFQGLSYSAQNAWLTDLADRHRYAYRVLIHTRAAHARGIDDGDEIRLVASTGTVTGIAALTEGIHPDVVAVAGISGHWARGMPNAYGRGTHFNSLLPLDLDDVDKLSSAFDSNAKVRLERVGPRRPSSSRKLRW